jgi:hypothetical protein
MCRIVLAYHNHSGGVCINYQCMYAAFLVDACRSLCLHRACMSEGQHRLVVLLHQAAKAEGGSDKVMPPLRQMALQAAVATQQWEEGGRKVLAETCLKSPVQSSNVAVLPVHC